MLSMFYRQENPGVTCAKNLRKGTKPKIREILPPHLCKQGLANKLIFLAKLSPIVKSELKNSVKKNFDSREPMYLVAQFTRRRIGTKDMVEVMKCLPRSEGCNVSFNTYLYNSQKQSVVGCFHQDVWITNKNQKGYSLLGFRKVL